MFPALSSLLTSEILCTIPPSSSAGWRSGSICGKNTRTLLTLLNSPGCCMLFQDPRNLGYWTGLSILILYNLPTLRLNILIVWYFRNVWEPPLKPIITRRCCWRHRFKKIQRVPNFLDVFGSVDVYCNAVLKTTERLDRTKGKTGSGKRPQVISTICISKITLVKQREHSFHVMLMCTLSPCRTQVILKFSGCWITRWMSQR